MEQLQDQISDVEKASHEEVRVEEFLSVNPKAEARCGTLRIKLTYFLTVV